MLRRHFWGMPLGALAASYILACGLARVGDESIAAAVGGRDNEPAQCGTCHKEVAARYATSAHAARHILCGQCHGGAEHPDPDGWVTDGTCAGCHQSQYQQQLGSAHFIMRVLVDPQEPPFPARDGVEERSFFVRKDGMLLFAGLAGEGNKGGLLCVGCHYAGHRFVLGTVRKEGACEACHPGLAGHYRSDADEAGNRCVSCHVFQGRTEFGQVINSHRFQVVPETGG